MGTATASRISLPARSSRDCDANHLSLAILNSKQLLNYGINNYQINNYVTENNRPPHRIKGNLISCRCEAMQCNRKLFSVSANRKSAARALSGFPCLRSALRRSPARLELNSLFSSLLLVSLSSESKWATGPLSTTTDIV